MGIRLPERNNTFNIGEKVTAVDINDTLNALVSKERLFTDGIVASQITDNADVVFGQNDATTKRLKIAQSFLATRTTLKSILLKKGTSILESTGISTDTTGSTFTYSEIDTNANYSDAGVVSSSHRRILVSANYWYGADRGSLSKSFTTVPNKAHTLNCDIAGLFGTSGSANASMNCDIIVDGVVLLTVTSGTQGTFVTRTVNFTPTGSSSTVEFRIRTFGGGYNQSPSIPQNYEFKNFSVTYMNDNAGDVTVKVYGDNGSDAPNTTLLGTATISQALWIANAVNGTILATFSTFLSGLFIGTKYWLVLESTAPNANRYPSIRKHTAGGYVDGSAKYNNTTDGWQVEAGDFYFLISEDKTNKVAQTDNTGKVPYSLLSIDVYGDGSDGDVIISSNTTLVRDMFYNNLTINSTFTLSNNGFKIFVKGTLTNNGIIANNGANASGITNGAGAGGGQSGGIGFRNSYYYDYAGGGGASAGIIPIFARVVAVGGVINAIGGNGGVGAINQGGSGSNSGNAFGNGVNSDCTLIQTGQGGKGGGATNNGGTITVSSLLTFIPQNLANLFDFILNKTIKGGGGGGGGQNAVTNTNADGGGGGQGGLILFVFSLITGSAPVINVNGGLGGVNVGGGNNGSNGSNGRYLSINV